MTQQKVALVTGVSSGIGRATAILLADRGFHVFGTSRRPNGRNGLWGTMEVVPLDVRVEESVRTCVATVLEKAGRIDALVNNAGHTLIGAAEETTVQEARELFDTNFFGVLRITQAVLPIMRQQHSGRVAIIGSAVGFLPAPYQAIYAASKHALEGYAESLDHEVRQFGIRAAVIEPSFIRTSIALNSQLAAEPIEAYDKDRDHVGTAVRERVASGEDPVRVALVVWEALTTRSPRVRYTAGRQAKLLSVLRKFSPAGLFERGLRRQFRLDTA